MKVDLNKFQLMCDATWWLYLDMNYQHGADDAEKVEVALKFCRREVYIIACPDLGDDLLDACIGSREVCNIKRILRGE